MNITKMDILERKVKTPYEIRAILDNSNKKSNRKIGLLSGCYDGGHNGHLELISMSKNYQGTIKKEDNIEKKYIIDIIIMAINSDRSVRSLKGPNRPIVCQDDRVFALASLEYVDFVTTFDEPVVDEILKIIKPNFFIKGDHYSYDSLTENERNLFKEYNIEPLFLPIYKHYSTTYFANQMEANLKGLKCICSERLNKKDS